MRSESLDFLIRLVNASSPSGYEAPASSLFVDYVSPFSDDVMRDVIGNVAAVVNPGGSPRIMLSGHVDEIGFIVRYISEEGLIFFGPIGGHDPVIPAGQRVTIRTHQGLIPGVIGRKPIHLIDPDDRGKAPKLHDLWVDVGAKDKDEAEKLVSLGDPITYADQYEALHNGRAAAKSFDNKMGAFIVAEAARLLSENRPRAAVYAVATVQEEIGLFGAATGAFGIDPQVAVATDVTQAADYPDISKKRVGDMKLGGGPVICRGSKINHQVFKMLIDAAQKENIPFQIEVAGGGTGTDADAIHAARAGVATGLVSVALRYMHTPCEVLQLSDVEQSAQLIAAFCRTVTEETDFIPR
ncbi:MAG: M42 family metallopeptidase [Armatimonadetes bacterium]|nr:M42 family metallopeptidase [Armatimonadota bacterium]